MQIRIDDGQSIASIQALFTKMFPYLKLEFFSTPYVSSQASAQKHPDVYGRKIGQYRSIHNSGCINIIPEMTVEQLEKQFLNIYGLTVQIFRKSGNIWLETTVTDSWTLQKQNKQGEELSTLQGEKLVMQKFRPDSHFRR